MKNDNMASKNARTSKPTDKFCTLEIRIEGARGIGVQIIEGVGETTKC